MAGGKHAEIEKHVEERVKKHWDAANIKSVKINETIHNFLRGTLYFVSIYDADNTEHENYVYVKGDTIIRFDNARDIALGIARDVTIMDRFADLFEVTGISGVIALIITVTICFLATSGTVIENDLLKTLELSLTSILGFYFGASRKFASNKRDDERAG